MITLRDPAGSTSVGIAVQASQVPARTIALFVALLVPVLVLAVLNAMEVAPSPELKAALATLTTAAAGALGHGFVSDARKVAAAKRRSQRRIEAAAPDSQDDDAGESAADTHRVARVRVRKPTDARTEEP